MVLQITHEFGSTFLMITSACFPELPVEPRPSKHLLPSRQSFSKEGVRRVSTCICLLPPRQGDLQGRVALTRLLIVDMFLAMCNLATRNQPKNTGLLLFLTSKTGSLPCHYSKLHRDKRLLCIPPGLSTHVVFTRLHADCTAKFCIST